MPSSLAGLAVSALSSWREFDVAVVIKAKRCAEQGLEADGAVGGLGEGAALAVGASRIVGRDDHVDIAARHALDHGAAVVLRAQRRLHLEEGAVGADIVLVEREVIDRHAAGDGQAHELGGADDVERGAAGDLAA